jgi:hypothetical protein
MAIRNIQLSFDIFYGHFGNFVVVCLRFGILYQEKSGNPAGVSPESGEEREEQVIFAALRRPPVGRGELQRLRRLSNEQRLSQAKEGANAIYHFDKFF